MEPERFAQPALNTIAVNCFTDRFGYGEPEPGTFSRSRPSETKRRKQWAGDTETPVIDQTEIRGAKNPGRPGKRVPQDMLQLVLFALSRLWRNGRLFRH